MPRSRRRSTACSWRRRRGASSWGPGGGGGAAGRGAGGGGGGGGAEGGVGEGLDEKRRGQRGVNGPAILPALRAAGFDPGSVDAVAVSHLHWDHAGGILAADGALAFPRARIVAQRVEWSFALGDNPRLVASYEQEELRLVEAMCLAGAADGQEGVIPAL